MSIKLMQYQRSETSIIYMIIDEINVYCKDNKK